MPRQFLRNDSRRVWVVSRLQICNRIMQQKSPIFSAPRRCFKYLELCNARSAAKPTFERREIKNEFLRGDFGGLTAIPLPASEPRRVYTQVREVSARLRLKTGKINLIYQRFGILRSPIFAVIVLCLILSVVFDT